MKTNTDLAQLKEENKRLKRELEIETALEKVRTRAMGMQVSSDLLDIVVTMRNEFTALGHEAHYFWHMRWLQDKYEKAMTSGDGTRIGMVMDLPRGFHEDARMLDWEKAKTPVGVFTYDVEGAIDYVDKMVKTGRFDLVDHNAPGPDDIRHIGGITFIMARTKHGEIGYSLPGIVANPPPDDINTLEKFAGVFDLAYRRFEDLKSAEHRNRETQIELALEKVRSRTMAMQRSDELAEASFLLDSQIRALGIETRGCAFNIYGEQESTEWFSSEAGTLPVYKTPRENVFLKYYKAGQKGETLVIKEFAGEACAAHYDYLCTVPVMGEALRKLKENGGSFPARQIDHVAFFKYGYLLFITLEPVQEAHDIFKRFAKVFEQTYTRFLDLQKAEAQAREAQIEAALERVRAKAMAMHSSKDISGATIVVFNELGKLGIEFERCGIGINNDTPVLEIWSTPLSPEHNQVVEIITGKVDTAIHPLLQGSYKSWVDKKPFYSYELKGKEVKKYYDLLEKVPGYHFPKIAKYPERQFINTFNFNEGGIFVYQKETLSEDTRQILHRFTKVFEQTYRRYLDIIKAEAQAREAQIEAALERVRSRSMAMQSSDELVEASDVMLSELKKLDIETIRVGICTIDRESESAEIWSRSENKTENHILGIVPKGVHPVFDGMVNAWKEGKSCFSSVRVGAEVKRYYKKLAPYLSYPLPEKFNKQETITSFFFSEGSLNVVSYQPLQDADKEIMLRFAKVFGQIYRRFLDLQKAEAQAREAQIEAALERIRSKALAMQSSADLHGVSIVLREQMGMLGQADLESSIVHLYNSSETLESWYTFRSTKTKSKKTVTDVAIIPVDSCEYIKETLEKYQSEESEYTIVSEGKKLVDWYHVMVKVAPDTIEYNKKGKMLVPDILYYHHSKFKGGALLMISNKKPSEEAKELQRRAAKVFNLAYLRFLDLQQAEARTRESIKQASLDRVRAEIAGMRTTKDLERITPLIWTELKTLGVPFFRCGVFIMNEQTKTAKVYLSAPSGESLAVWESEFEKIPMIKASVAYWRKQKIYREEWDQEKFMTLTKSLMQQNLIKDAKHYQAGEEAPEHLSLLFVPFTQGMLYAGSEKPQEEEQIELVQSLAKAFSVAYARYEDFNELETAKAHIEKTLSELKATQSQLIQSEKMASLGELTAGIAHEIQNPLNFVNNFSEVSKELIEELKAERLKLKAERDEGLEEEILDDVIKNLEKIHHHGERASGIVKGMLEHSRTGDGKKEPTDINALADEYLRLAYHGLRAKDKTFNADFKTEFDENLPKIQVIPQDIGRVLLNLINNAFYAVSSRLKAESKDYKPEVIVSTKKHENSIEISVRDNGGGVPEQVRDKIFQPFFTTKPTGSGTGLGLSLSYDIVKAHGGELRVESKEGEGSEFIIKLNK